MKVLVVGGVPQSLVNFRGPLLQAIRAKGHDVVAAAGGRNPDVEAKLREMGVAYFPVRMARTGMNPWADAATWLDLARLIRKERPAVVLGYTIKPVIYGGLAARVCGTRAIYSLVTGLGYAFVESATFRQRLAGGLAKFLYRWSLRHSRRVFFQNPDDAAAFVGMRLMAPDRVVVVNGSGVDLERFPFVERRPGLDQPTGVFRFLLIARLLRDKGIGEYAEAARLIHLKHPQAEFHLVGDVDPNPAGIQAAQVGEWTRAGILAYHGRQNDVRPFLAAAGVYVLPSYREGTPRTVLEAMAAGCAILTTDAPGCRETVKSWETGKQTPGKLQIGENGILVPPRDAATLAEAMEYFIRHPQETAAMGRASRRYAEERYDVRKVNAAMLEAMQL